MYDKKLLRIIASMEEEELKACRKYLKAFLNSKSDEFLLFKYIWDTKHNLQSKKLELSRTHNRLKPDIKLKSFLNILSRLTKHIENFLIFHKLSDDSKKFDRGLMLGEIYKRKGLYDCFNEVHKELENLSTKMNEFDLKYHWNAMLRHEQIFFSEHLPKGGRIKSLIKIDEHLKKFSAEWSLFSEIESINREKLLNKAIVFPDTFESTPLEKVLIILKELVGSNNSISYQKLEELLITKPTPLSKQLAQIILIYLINYCSYHIKLGKTEFIDKLAFLYDFGFKEDILTYNGQLFEKHFLNAIDAKSKATITYDIPDFIENRIPITASKNLKTLKDVAYAMYCFADEKYSEALDFANAPNTLSDNLNLSLRVQLIRICCLCSLYDDYLNKQEVLSSTLSFFKNHQSSINPTTFEGILNLLKIIRMIWDKTPLLDIKAFMNQPKSITFRNWIDKRLALIT